MLSSISTDGALHGRLIRSPQVAQARQSRVDEQCRTERMRRGEQSCACTQDPSKRARHAFAVHAYAGESAHAHGIHAQSF